MTETLWFLVVGVLIFMGLASSTFKRLPISTAMCYLAIGFALGPSGAGLLHLDLLGNASVLRRITEVAMLVSLFAIGLRLRVPPTDRIWFLPIRLGFVAMVFTVAALTLFCVHVLGFTWGPSLLLAAMLAPTDPVLAHDVQVETPGDIDLLRFSLTGEGGLNDGIALPFALLGIAVAGTKPHRVKPYDGRLRRRQPGASSACSRAAGYSANCPCVWSPTCARGTARRLVPKASMRSD